MKVSPSNQSILQEGFSLIEVLISVSLGAIITTLLALIFLSTNKSYDLQNQIMQMDQNAYYTIKSISEVLESAGSDLPSSGWSIIRAKNNPTDSFQIDINPKGGKQIFSNAVASTLSMPVDDWTGFKEVSQVKLLTYESKVAPKVLAIQTNYAAKNWVNGLYNSDSLADSVRLTQAQNFGSGDTVYAFTTKTIQLKNSNLLINNEAVAENIDSLSILFLDKDKAKTLDWSKLLYISITLKVRTERPDVKYKLEADGFRRITLTKNLRLKNKF